MSLLRSHQCTHLLRTELVQRVARAVNRKLGTKLDPPKLGHALGDRRSALQVHPVSFAEVGCVAGCVVGGRDEMNLCYLRVTMRAGFAGYRRL